MFTRDLSPILIRFAQIYPIVGITGPRQSGKTTLAKTLFAHLPYVSLENPDTQTLALGDPRSFLKKYTDGAIFDEIQNTPKLLSYLQEIVDSSSTKGRFVITGAQNFTLSQAISQTLPGRIGLATLLPLTMHERQYAANTPLEKLIFQGLYPGLHDRGMLATEFYPSYLQTYVDRDVRQITNVENLGTFHTFLKMCAGRTGQIINISGLAEDCGISRATARNWLSILETSYIIFFLQPFYKNFSKRLIKMPKLYFHDTGVACSLLGLEAESQLASHYLRGGLFENFIITELLKSRFNKGLPANLYFWRDQGGYEIDCMAEWGTQLNAIEIKSGATFQTDFVKNLTYLEQLEPNIKKFLVYTGDMNHQYKETQIVPHTELSLVTG